MKKISPIWNIDRDVLQKIILNNSTYAGVLRQFDLPNSSIATLRKRIKKDNLVHDTLKGGYKPDVHGKLKRELSDVLVENSTYSRNHLKRRLINAGLINNKCAFCGLTEWYGKNLVLELDHINGIRNDNRLTNLRLLCPNCHSCTETFSGRNSKGNRWCKQCGIPLMGGVCGNGCEQVIHKCQCGKEISRKSKRCGKCSGVAQRRVERPSKEQLMNLIQDIDNWMELGRMFGVTDNTVRKWARKYQLL